MARMVAVSKPFAVAPGLAPAPAYSRRPRQGGPIREPSLELNVRCN